MLCCTHIFLRQEILMDCCGFDFKIWWQSVVLYLYMASTEKNRCTVVILTLRFGGKVLCCIIYGLDRKSRLTVVTLTLRFGGKALCCIYIWLRQEIQMYCCDFDFNIWWQSAMLYHIWLRQEIQMDCCDFDFKIWWQSAVLYPSTACCNRLHAWWSTKSRLATLLSSLIAHQ